MLFRSGTAPDGHPPAQAQAPTQGAGLPQRNAPGANFPDPFGLTRIAIEKQLPFAPLVPNAETIAAIKESRQGKLAKAND